jgi:hypothetical protein
MYSIRIIVGYFIIILSGYLVVIKKINLMQQLFPKKIQHGMILIPRMNSWDWGNNNSVILTV